MPFKTFLSFAAKACGQQYGSFIFAPTINNWATLKVCQIVSKRLSTIIICWIFNRFVKLLALYKQIGWIMICIAFGYKWVFRVKLATWASKIIHWWIRCWCKRVGLKGLTGVEQLIPLTPESTIEFSTIANGWDHASKHTVKISTQNHTRRRNWVTQTINITPLIPGSCKVRGFSPLPPM